MLNSGNKDLPNAYCGSLLSAAVTIEKLRQTFAAYGLPPVVVSDNATAFTSVEFGTFMKGNGIKHMFSPPRHPASNGQVEALVKVVKNSIRNRTGSLQTRLSRFLLAYRTTPHSTTGQPPAALLFGRTLHTRPRRTMGTEHCRHRGRADMHCAAG